MRTTQEIRVLYSPACQAKGNLLAMAYAALNRVLRKYGYVLRPGDTGAYNCRKITGGSGWSLHAYGPGWTFVFWNGVSVTMSVAVDLNWLTNPYGPRLVTDMPREMINEIMAIKTVDGIQVWRWGGYFSGNKDAMHFEVVVSPAELARGIAGQGDDDEMNSTQEAKLDRLLEALGAADPRKPSDVRGWIADMHRDLESGADQPPGSPQNGVGKIIRGIADGSVVVHANIPIPVVDPTAIAQQVVALLGPITSPDPALIAQALLAHMGPEIATAIAAEVITQTRTQWNKV